VKYKDEDWLRETYREHSIQEMADMIDCSTATIHNYMEKYGIERPDKNQSKDGPHKDREWLREKYHDEKLSQKEIAEIADIHKGTVKYWLDRHDIDIRSKSEAAEIRAERYPHTTTAGAEALTEHHSTPQEEMTDEEFEAFKQRLSENRRGEDNPMYDRTGEDHPRWKEDKAPHRFYASKKWEQTRQNVLEQDDYECQACGMGMEEHKETHGMALHVHHIHPISAGGARFDENNLVTLCNTHHREYEGLYLRPDTGDYDD